MTQDNRKHLEDLSEIRSIMERSTTFISLSGLSGVFAGIWALLGAAFAYWYLYVHLPVMSESRILPCTSINTEVAVILFADALIILVLTLTTGYYFTLKNSRKKGQKIWNSTSKRLLISLLIPLISGGLFSFILLFQGTTYLIPAVTLMFYGLALVNASKYTLHDIKYLGIIEIVLGLCAALGFNLFFWALGFGVFHIIYGMLMYYKYEKNPK